MAFLSPAVADASAFTAAASPLTPVGGVWNDALAALTAGQIGELRITEKRAAHVNLRSETGTELATAAAPLRVDPTGTTKQPITLFDSAGTAITLASGRLVVDGSGVTQPISAAALPLPTGAATAAKQPALGVAGTASADVITVQGKASMTPVNDNLVQLAGTAVDVNSGVKSAGTLRIVLATDQPALTTPLPAQAYVLASSDVVSQQRFGNLFIGGGFSSGAAVTVFTAPVGQRYYITGFWVTIDPSSTTTASAVSTIVLQDSATSNFFAMYFKPGAILGTIYVASPVGFFYKSTNTGAYVDLIATTGFSGTVSVGINYGLTLL
jgi:hypothetical protein